MGTAGVQDKLRLATSQARAPRVLLNLDGDEAGEHPTEQIFAVSAKNRTGRRRTGADGEGRGC